MYYIGIDIGGTKIAGAIVSDDGQITDRQETPTPIKDGGNRILQDALEIAKSILSGAKKKIEAIGIGAGGQIDTTHGVVY